MSDKNKNKKNFPGNLFRYLRNELTAGERNSWEKELQKDPFAEEAAEGLSSLSEEEVSEDLSFLNKQIGRRTGKGQKLIFFRIAASVVLLLAIGSLVIIGTRRSSQEVAINSAPVKEYEITSSQPIRKAEDKSSAKEPAESITGSGKRTARNEKADVLPDYKKPSTEQPARMEMQRNDSIQELRSKLTDIHASEKAMAAPAAVSAKSSLEAKYALTGRVISSEDKMPVPGANVTIRGTREGAITDAAGNFSIAVPDSGRRALEINYIGMQSKQVDAKPERRVDVILDPSIESLSEVVVTGYGRAAKNDDYYDSESGHTPPVPVSGRSEFNKFIQDNLRRPDTIHSEKRLVVILNFIVRRDGRLDSIIVVRSPGKIYSDEAIRVLKSAPEWKPAEENGTRVDDKVRLRIVFK